MQLKRLCSSILLLGILTMPLSGCIRKDTPPPKPVAPKVQLVYYKLFDDEDVMLPFMQEYQAKHPNISIKYKKFTDSAEYENLIINELAEGEGPDIISAPNFWFLRNSKKINPLPSATMSPEQFDKTFVNVTSQDLTFADPADGKRKIFAIPLTVDTLGLYYNKAAFEDAIPSRGRPADTWEELKDDVYKLTKKDNSFERFQVAGIAMGRADNIARAVDTLYLLMLQFKTHFYNDNFSQATFAKENILTSTGVALNPAAQALDLYTSFALPSNKNYSWNEYLANPKTAVKEMETFARGKVSMIFGYSYLYEQIKNEIKDLKDKGLQTIDPNNIRLSVVPQVNSPSTSTESRVAYANYYAETVTRTSQHPQEAWDFLLYLSSKENLTVYNQKTHKPTSRRDMIEDQKRDTIYGPFAEQIGFAQSFPIYNYLRYDEIFRKAIDAVLATTTVTDAIKTAENDINALLPDGGLLPPKKTSPKPAAATKANTSTSNASTSTSTKTPSSSAAASSQ